MKIVAFTCLHYGLDYLEYVIRSTQNFAEQHIIMYTPRPSPGYHNTSLQCPDSRQDLYRLARSAAGKRLIWIDEDNPCAEAAMALRPDADLLFGLDSDEVIDPYLAQKIIRLYQEGKLNKRKVALPMIHFWRSFNHVCRNPGWPVRLYVPKAPDDSIEYLAGGEESGAIYHFGYCRRRADMEYKVALSVHLPEWRSDWWEKKFNAFPHTLTDVHPVCVDMWTAIPYDKTKLPGLLHHHPFYPLEVVE